MMGQAYARLIENAAVQTYGMEHQIRKFHEEMGEVMQAMNRYLNGEDSLEHLAEELADLSVTTEEMVLGFDIVERFNHYKTAKLERLWYNIQVLKRRGQNT